MFTQEQLETAFARVQNKHDWKMPIKTTILIENKEELKLIESAIVHFTATHPRFEFGEANMVKVFADGYRAGPAGP